MLRICIIGCGTIGKEIARTIDRKKIIAKLVAIYDIDLHQSKKLLSCLKHQKTKICKNLLDTINSADLVVECASQNAVKEICQKAFNKHKDVFVMSVGGLLINSRLFDLAKKRKCNLYFPSGAIVGLDGISAAKYGKIKKVTLTTTKPAKSLIDTSHKIRKPKIIFEGEAKKAVKLFPKNINVSAALSLTGIGPEKTKVRIIADPKIKRNVHEIEIVGDFGRIFTRSENVPSKTNPKTSYLAILSAISTLNHITKQKYYRRKKK